MNFWGEGLVRELAVRGWRVGRKRGAEIRAFTWCQGLIGGDIRRVGLLHGVGDGGSGHGDSTESETCLTKKSCHGLYSL